MGYAFYTPGADFDDANLGKVTIAEDIDVTAISINGASSINNEDNKATYSVSFTPTNTNQRRISWSIESGSQYATIDQNGVVSVLSGAENASVTIKAQSLDNSSIYATKKITVSYIKVEKALYRLPAETNERVDTGLQLSDGNAHASIFIEFVINKSSDNDSILLAMDEVSPWNGFVLRLFSDFIDIAASATTQIESAKINESMKVGLSIDGTAIKYTTDGTTWKSAGTIKGSSTTNAFINGQRNGAEFTTKQCVIFDEVEKDLAMYF